MMDAPIDGGVWLVFGETPNKLMLTVLVAGVSKRSASSKAKDYGTILQGGLRVIDAVEFDVPTLRRYPGAKVLMHINKGRKRHRYLPDMQWAEVVKGGKCVYITPEITYDSIGCKSVPFHPYQ